MTFSGDGFLFPGVARALAVGLAHQVSHCMSDIKYCTLITECPGYRSAAPPCPVAGYGVWWPETIRILPSISLKIARVTLLKAVSPDVICFFLGGEGLFSGTLTFRNMYPRGLSDSLVYWLVD